MEEVLAEVKKLNCAELRSKLIELGDAVGPITTTTKLLFQKRLAKRIYESKHGKAADEEGHSSGQKIQEQSTPDEVRDRKSTQIANPTQYFAVCLSPEDLSKAKGEQLVVTVKEELHSLLKKYPGSRFKAFKTLAEATDFMKQDQASCTQRDQSQGQDLLTLGEKSSFRGPRCQDLVRLRLAIEDGRLKDVKDLVWGNPRYLVGSADNPTILHEGARYNALHVAAKMNKAELCRFLLNTLADPSFTGLLYAQSKDTEDTNQKRITFLLDLYLNMPDRGSCESPLHLACKFGHVDVVQELMQYRAVDCSLKNKYGETPFDVACSRCTDTSTLEGKKKVIRELLEGLCFVPLLRSEDNSTLPVIGEPSSPDVPAQDGSKFGSPRDPKLVVKAYAGPMSPSRAKQFHRHWATPPSSPHPRLSNIRCEDFEKGMEQVGRDLAGKMHVPWKEYWEFLDTFLDLRSEEGLQRLEHHLARIHMVTAATTLLQVSPNLAVTPTRVLLPPPPSTSGPTPSLPLTSQSQRVESSQRPTPRSFWPTEKSGGRTTQSLPQGSELGAGARRKLDLQPDKSPPSSSSPDSLGSRLRASGTSKSASGLAPWLSSPLQDVDPNLERGARQLQLEFTHLRDELNKYKERCHITSTPVSKDDDSKSGKSRVDRREREAFPKGCSPRVNLLDRLEEGDNSNGIKPELPGVSKDSETGERRTDKGTSDHRQVRDLEDDYPSSVVHWFKDFVDVESKSSSSQHETAVPSGSEGAALTGGEMDSSSQQMSDDSRWKRTRLKVSDTSEPSVDSDLNLSGLSLEDAAWLPPSGNSTMSELCSLFADKLFITPVLINDQEALSPQVDQRSEFKLSVEIPPSVLEKGKPTSVALMLCGEVEAMPEEELRVPCSACFLWDSLSREDLLRGTVLGSWLCAKKDSIQQLLQLKTTSVNAVVVEATPPEAARVLPVRMPAYIFSQALCHQQIKKCFLLGEHASKLDLDVYRAVPAQVDCRLYPAIHKWHCLVSALELEGGKSSFPSPARVLRDSRSQLSPMSTPASLRSLLGRPSSLLQSPASLSWIGEDKGS